MTPAKRNKIKALMESPAATDNEKAICKKLLEKHPEPKQKLSERQSQRIDDILSGRARSQRAAYEFIRVMCSECKVSFTSYKGAGVDKCPSCRIFGNQAAGRAQSSNPFGGPGGMFGTGLGSDSYRRQQQAQNNFMSELSRIMAEEIKKKEK